MLAELEELKSIEHDQERENLAHQNELLYLESQMKAKKLKDDQLKQKQNELALRY